MSHTTDYQRLSIPAIAALTAFGLLLALGGASGQAQSPVRTPGESATVALGTAFTYQGQLVDGGSPANGSYDLRFILFDADLGGSQVGAIVSVADAAVVDGKFTVLLDFGEGSFDGQERWLEVAVRPGESSGEYTTLSPRQPLTPAPYAMYSINSDQLDGQHANAFAGVSHDHLGETWIGSNNSLVISGTFGAHNAPIVLSNSSGDGLRIIADVNGVRVASAAVGMSVYSPRYDGIHIYSAGRDGVYVDSASWNGVAALSTNPDAYGGWFQNQANGGAGLFTRGGSNSSADLVLGGFDAASDDGRISSDPAFTGSDLFLFSNDAIQLELDNDNDESGNMWVQNGENNTVFSINEAGDMTAIGTKSALVSTQDYGRRKLYALESPQN